MEPTLPPSPRWLHVCALDDIPLLGSRGLAPNGGAIALFRPPPQQLFALLVRCPHKGVTPSHGLFAAPVVSSPPDG
ncbi:nitrite reductase (NAD(P)H) small subunit, partial [Pseudomonas sp. MWU13-2860]